MNFNLGSFAGHHLGGDSCPPITFEVFFLSRFMAMSSQRISNKRHAQLMVVVVKHFSFLLLVVEWRRRSPPSLRAPVTCSVRSDSERLQLTFTPSSGKKLQLATGPQRVFLDRWSQWGFLLGCLAFRKAALRGISVCSQSATFKIGDVFILGFPFIQAKQ